MSEWDMSFIKQYTVQDGTLFEIIQVNFFFYL